MIQELLSKLQQGDAKALARSISLVENEADGYEGLLQSFHIIRINQLLVLPVLREQERVRWLIR